VIRPPFISVIGWLLIASGILGLLGLGFQLFWEPASTLLHQSGFSPAASTVIYLVCGSAILAGSNWGRHLLTVSLSAGMVLGVFLSPAKWALVPALLFLVLMVGPLYRPIASRYFLRQQTNADIEALESRNESEAIGRPRKILGIVLLIVLFVISGLIVYLLTLISFVVPDPAVDKPVRILLWFGAVWLLCHALALLVFATPSRQFTSGLSLLAGSSFTLFIMVVIFFYPLPADYADMDVKQSLGNFSTGIPLLTAFLVAGGIQLAVGIRSRNRKPMTQPH
jgi:hypothetical protein